MRSFKIHRCLNFIRSRFTTSKNKLGQDSPFPNFLHLKIRLRNGVESLTTLEEGEFKFAIDGCIKKTPFPQEFCNEICTIYVRAIQNHNFAKKKTKKKKKMLYRFKMAAR